MSTKYCHLRWHLLYNETDGRANGRMDGRMYDSIAKRDKKSLVDITQIKVLINETRA